MKDDVAVKPALLTRNEIEWLQGKIELSANYKRKIKCDIRRKIKVYQELELPLLVKYGFISEMPNTTNCNAATANCNIDKNEIPTLQLNTANHAQSNVKIVGRKGLI